MPGEWLTTVECGRLLGVSDDTVRRLVAERVLPASLIVRAPGRPPTIRIHRRDLEAFRARHVRNSVTDDWER